MTLRVRYLSNNSGGSWWLTKKDWEALESVGWIVEWTDSHTMHRSFARTAVREGLTMNSAIDEFERIANQDAEDEGCPCCGPPHDFTYIDEEGYMVFGIDEFGRTR